MSIKYSWQEKYNTRKPSLFERIRYGTNKKGNWNSKSRFIVSGKGKKKSYYDTWGY